MYKDNSKCSISRTATACIWGASLTGDSHLKNAGGCQDSFSVEHSGNDCLVVVADGAGSARYGAEGAKIACQEAVTQFQHSRESGDSLSWGRSAVASARAQIAVQSAKEDCSIRDFACTLLFAWIRRGAMIVWHIGDGGLVVRTSDGNLITVSGPENGAYANETHFITASNWESHLRLKRINIDWSELAAFSDGFQRVALLSPNCTPFPGFFHPVFDCLDIINLDRPAEAIEELARSPFLRKKTDDDLTLVLAKKADKYIS